MIERRNGYGDFTLELAKLTVQVGMLTGAVDDLTADMKDVRATQNKWKGALASFAALWALAAGAGAWLVSKITWTG